MITPFKTLPHRSLLRLSGEETLDFLQDLLTNDVAPLKEEKAVYAALLTPQGKILHDMLLTLGSDKAVYMDVERARRDDLIKRLTMYRLRRKVTIEDLSENWSVGIEFEDDTEKITDNLISFPDPRHPEMGWRIFQKAPVETTDATSLYDQRRIPLAIPDGSRDIEIERNLLLEANFDQINGVSFKKGCYMGQELAARMKYRGTIRKRLIPARIEGPFESGDMILDCNNKKVGPVRSKTDDMCLVFTRLEYLTSSPHKTEKGSVVQFIPPSWMKMD